MKNKEYSTVQYAKIRNISQQAVRFTVKKLFGKSNSTEISNRKGLPGLPGVTNVRIFASTYILTAPDLSKITQGRPSKYLRNPKLNATILQK